MQISLDKIVVMICSIAILNAPLFFTFMGLFGVEYEGSESSNIYVSYIVLVAGLSLISYLYGVVIKGVLRKESIIIIIFIFLFSLHILWILFDQESTIVFPEFLIFFILFGLPGFFAAATIIKLNLIYQLIRFSEILFLIMACGITMFSILPTFIGIKVASLAGASYQTLSYYSAFTFGMLLIYNVYLPKTLRFYWASYSWYKGLSYGLILACILGCFIGGGRGAFLLLISYMFLILIPVLLNSKRFLTLKKMPNTFLRLFGAVLLLLVFFGFFWEREFVQTGFSRATQFISVSGGIDIERGSSGRNIVYQNAIDFISEKPIIGYGPFGFREKTIQAHNLFLEVLLQFGSIGLIVFLLLSGCLAINTIRNWSVYSYWVFGLLLYPLVMTMFSGAYMHSALFFFGVSFMTIYREVKPGFIDKI